MLKRNTVSQEANWHYQEREIQLPAASSLHRSMASHLKEFLSVGFGIMNCVYRMKLIPLERGLHLAVFFFILIAKLLKHFQNCYLRLCIQHK